MWILCISRGIGCSKFRKSGEALSSVISVSVSVDCSLFFFENDFSNVNEEPTKFEIILILRSSLYNRIH